MNDMASMRKMRPLEPAGSGGSAGAFSGLGAESGLADFFFGGKGEFYQEGSFKFRVSRKSRVAADFRARRGSIRGITPQTCNPHTSRTGTAHFPRARMRPGYARGRRRPTPA